MLSCALSTSLIISSSASIFFSAMYSLKTKDVFSSLISSSYFSVSSTLMCFMEFSHACLASSIAFLVMLSNSSSLRLWFSSFAISFLKEESLCSVPLSFARMFMFSITVILSLSFILPNSSIFPFISNSQVSISDSLSSNSVINVGLSFSSSFVVSSFSSSSLSSCSSSSSGLNVIKTSLESSPSFPASSTALIL